MTITLLAQRLGVSVATVSSVLNNRSQQRRISRETVHRVQDAAAEVGYLPNISARRLRSGRSGQYLVLAVVTSYEAPLTMVSAAIAALHRLLGQEKYKGIQSAVTVEMFNAGRLADLPGLCDGSRFNGAIIANTAAADDAFLAASQFSIPVVLLGRDIPNYSSVRELSEKTGQQAAEVLLAAGSRNLAVLHARLLTQATGGRLKGFCDKLRSLGTRTPLAIVSEGFDEQDGYTATRQFLQQGHRMDGLYAIMDSLAVGAYHAIKESGLLIPQDIAVMGTGDLPLASFLDPPLSTFTRSQYNMQEEAGRLLLGHLTGEIRKPTQVLIPVLPVLRSSTRRGQWAGP